MRYVVKICNTCHEKKANKHFSVNNRFADNLHRTCKPCDSARRKSIYDPERAKKSWKRNKYSTPEYAESRRLKAAYGITKSFRDFISRRQGGVCAICSEAVKLVVDHDHVSGIVRGLLCNKCNLALGGFNDDVDRLGSAYKYLLDFNEKQSAEFK